MKVAMANINQKIKAGDNSTNVTVVYQGVSYNDVKSISLDLFELNFPKLVGRAAEIAQENMRIFLDDYLKKRVEENFSILNLSSLSSPDMLVNLTHAVTSCAQKGDKLDMEVLADLIIEKMQYNVSEFRNNLISEAIAILPKLTKLEIIVLAFIYYIKAECLVTVEPSIFNYKKYLNDFLSQLDTYYLYISEEVRDFFRGEDKLEFEYLKFLKLIEIDTVSPQKSFVKYIIKEYKLHLYNESDLLDYLKNYAPNIVWIQRKFEMLDLGTYSLTPIGKLIALCYLKPKTYFSEKGIRKK